ncbi:MAG: PPOX class F420-dependent oxidoreductase [Microthrixaceae bacterium]
MLPIPQSHVDLVSRPLGCVITTITPDDLPQSTGMWFLFDEGRIRFSLLESRRKYRNLRANPACTFFLMSPDSMIDTIEVRGRATFEADPDKEFVQRVRDHYSAQGPPADGPDDVRWVVTIDPVRINVTRSG